MNAEFYCIAVFPTQVIPLLLCSTNIILYYKQGPVPFPHRALPYLQFLIANFSFLIEKTPNS